MGGNKFKFYLTKQEIAIECIMKTFLRNSV